MKDLLSVGAALASVLAWLTHVIYCLMLGKWGFLLAGAILAPIGIIHGFLIWMGVA